MTAYKRCINEAKASIVEEPVDKAEAAVAAATNILRWKKRHRTTSKMIERKNIQLFGLKKGEDGKQLLLDCIHDMLPQWLGSDVDRSFILEIANCYLAPAIPNHSRAVLVRFLKFQDREFVLRSVKQQDITHDRAKLAFHL